MPSRVWLFATPWTVDYQASLSMGFSRQEYWSGLPFPPPGDLPNTGNDPASPVPPALAHWQADSLPLSHQGSPLPLEIESQMAGSSGWNYWWFVNLWLNDIWCQIITELSTLPRLSWLIWFFFLGFCLLSFFPCFILPFIPPSSLPSLPSFLSLFLPISL